jgi:hypothetical protein
MCCYNPKKKTYNITLHCFSWKAKFYTQGQEVWIPHAKEGWICGKIQSLAGGKNELVVLPEDGGEVSFHHVKK